MELKVTAAPNPQEPPFTDCHWVGSGDCTDNRCDYDEVTLDVHEFGDGTACKCKF